ncbi:hypothetical protein [Gulosibacter molinativorax]|uniref:hypothetical protein n=1 Tax=Gulosibacter molinativorax TaxID=256821 RepID=UPI0011B252CE|nr:hypothetical protein [Gulosibacter molinativorax]QUY63661.1 Hypotetical protein [Gulosibacter molinativorax]
MTTNDDFNTPESKGVSRRTLMKGAAWAVPVIAVASASPAFAASPDSPVDPSAVPGTFCQHSNAKQYHGVFRFNNTVGVPVTVTLGTWVVPGDNTQTLNARFSVNGSLEAERDIPAGTHDFYIDGTGASDNANGVSTVYYDWSYVKDGVTYSGSSTISAPASGVNCNSTPPQPTGPAPH